MRLVEWVKLIESLRGGGVRVMHISALRPLTGLSAPSLNTALWRLQRAGLVIRVARGWVCLGVCEAWEVVKAAFPSTYISMEWALHHYEVLDRPSHVVTVMWLGKSRVVRSSAFTFELHRISRRLYFGFDPDKVIAEPEKALLDTIYIRGWAPPELNLDLLDAERLSRYASKYPQEGTQGARQPHRTLGVTPRERGADHQPGLRAKTLKYRRETPGAWLAAH